jgi:hypothetical protein
MLKLVASFKLLKQLHDIIKKNDKLTKDIFLSLAICSLARN